MAIKEIKVPNIGDVSSVEVIEIMVSPGDRIKKDDSIITLESDKASMEIPSPETGIVESVQVKVGDKVSEGATIFLLKSEAEAKGQETAPKESAPTEVIKENVTQSEEKDVANIKNIEPIEKAPPHISKQTDASIHASPAVRRLAREFGVEIEHVQATGPKNRIMKEDVQHYVKIMLSQSSAGESGIQVAKVPEIDFTKFGETEQLSLNKIKKLTGANLHRSWVTIPHVTQFGEADITDMEEFRKAQKGRVEKEGVKLTPLVFIMKAVIAALKAYPNFNASLDAKGENLIVKKYFNLGIAVDTPNGLVVPVIKNVDQKGMLVLAKELAEISQKAREKGLSPADMSGSCFTISSLGGIGGTAFTPIINAPDVAILGVSKASIKPIFNNNQFVPRLMLPLSLSYDHRVIDGADGARFIEYLSNCLSDLRSLLL